MLAVDRGKWNTYNEGRRVVNNRKGLVQIMAGGFFNRKNRRIITIIISVILVLAMVAPMVLEFLLM